MTDNDQDIKGELLSAPLSQEEDEKLKKHLTWNEHHEFWELPGSSYSDYGGSLVDKSNSRYFLKKYPELVVEYTGPHGSSSVGIPEEKLNGVDSDVLDSLIDDVKGLEDYPLLDEDDHSQLQMEAQWEAWDENYRDEYRKELQTKFGAYGLQAFAAAYVPNDRLDEIERENDNGEWEEEQGCSVYRNVKRLAEKTDLDDILGNGAMEKAYRKAKVAAWKNGFDRQFVDEIYRRFRDNSRVAAAVENGKGMFALADSLLEQVNGWEVNDDYDPDLKNSTETMIVPDWEDLHAALDTVNPERIAQAAGNIDDPRQMKLKLRYKPTSDAARVVADSLLERSDALPAPAWLVERMERLKAMPRPTLEQVRQQFEASREQSFKANLPDRYS